VKVYEQASSGATWCTCSRSTIARRPSSATLLADRRGPARRASIAERSRCARRRSGARGGRDSIDYARRRFREEVAAWPDGTYTSDVYVDHDPKGNCDVHVHCAVTVRGDHLTVDFTGSDTRPGSGWSTFGNTRGYVVAHARVDDGPRDPKNEGFFEAIELIVPEGCWPESDRRRLGAAHAPSGVEVGEAVCLALARVIPERACPQIYKAGCPRSCTACTGHGQVFVDHSVDATSAYSGATTAATVGASNASFGNLIRATAEINESIFPTRHEHHDFEPTPADRAKWRGNAGSRYVKRVTAPVALFTYQVGMKYPMPGVAVGQPGKSEPLHAPRGSADAQARHPHGRARAAARR
jgi:N-methylhydantoinase B